jgi:hypothetical protein
VKIQKHGVPYYESHNHNFNTCFDLVVDGMLQTQSEHPIGYVMSTGERDMFPSLRLQAKNADLVRGATEPPSDCHYEYNMTGLGNYERALLTALAWGKYSTTVIVGEMGSGKTAALKCVLARLRKPLPSSCKRCSAIPPAIFEINYNKGARTRSIEKVLEQFGQRLRDQLSRHLRDLLLENGMIQDVVDSIDTSASDEILVGLDDFLGDVVGSAAWADATQRQRVSQLRRWITKNVAEVYRQVEITMALIGRVHELHGGHGGPILLVFDNIDSVLPEAQYDLMLEILAYQEIAKVKAVVVLRQSTFAGLRAQRSYSFGAIRHCGPRPSTVVRMRLEYYVKSGTTDKLLVAQPEEARDAIIERARYVLREMNARGGIAEYLDAMAGKSVRLGLYIATRLFVNNQVMWNHAPAHRSDALRGLLLGTTPDIAPEDNSIVNLFVDTAGRFSLINLRILQILFEFDRRPELRTCANLRAILKNVGGWNGRDVRAALNNLMMIRRPLIWIDARSKLTGDEELHSELVVDLTGAGARYLVRLSTKLEYVQECLMSCDWHEDSELPSFVEYGEMVQRFDVLRRCLAVIVRRDADELARFLGATHMLVESAVQPRFISGEILAAIAGPVRAIVLAMQGEGSKFVPANRGHGMSWYSTLTDAHNSMRDLGLSVGIEKLLTVMKLYEESLDLRGR